MFGLKKRKQRKECIELLKAVLGKRGVENAREYFDTHSDFINFGFMLDRTHADSIASVADTIMEFWIMANKTELEIEAAISESPRKKDDDWFSDKKISLEAALGCIQVGPMDRLTSIITTFFVVEGLQELPNFRLDTNIRENFSTFKETTMLSGADRKPVCLRDWINLPPNESLKPYYP